MQTQTESRTTTRKTTTTRTRPADRRETASHGGPLNDAGAFPMSPLPAAARRGLDRAEEASEGRLPEAAELRGRRPEGATKTVESEGDMSIDCEGDSSDCYDDGGSQIGTDPGSGGGFTSDP